MFGQQISVLVRQTASLCLGAGLVALALALGTDQGLAAFLHKAASRVIENIEWLALLPANHSERFFLPYLALSFAAAFLITARQGGQGGGWRALFGRIFSREIYWHRSARIDYALILTDRIFTPAVLATRLLSTAALATWIASRLNGLLGAGEPLLSGVPAAVVFTLLFALAGDLADYMQHRLHHSSRVLWQLHRLHHSAEVLTPLTIFRVHPVEQVLGAVMSTVVIGLITGISSHWLMDSPRPITFLGTQLLMLFSYTFCAVHLRHSHVWLSWSPLLSRILISPAQHQIHHSVAPRHWNKNYGNVLALWDWIFGSLYVPRDRETLTFGLQEGQPHATLIDAYVEPLLAVWRQLVAWPHRAAASASDPARDLGDLPGVGRAVVGGEPGLGMLITGQAQGASRLVRMDDLSSSRTEPANARQGDWRAGNF